MQVSVTFRHMPASDAIKQHAEEKLSHLKKFIGDVAEVHVVLSVEHARHKADVNLNSRGMLIRGKEVSNDLYNSIDRAIDKIEKQVKKYKSKLADHHPREGLRRKMRFNTLEKEAEALEVTGSSLPPTVVETKEIDARPMMLDEAVMQMDLLHSDVLVFMNCKTEELNVLYRKKNDKYGLIEAHKH